MRKKYRRPKMEGGRKISGIEEAMVKVVCAWCGGKIGEKDGKGVDGTSHTMCQRCFDELVSRAEINEFGAGGDRAPAKEAKYGNKEGCDGEDRGRRGATDC